MIFAVDVFNEFLNSGQAPLTGRVRIPLRVSIIGG